MCVISMVYDQYNKTWPWHPTTPAPQWVPDSALTFTIPNPTVPEKTALEAFEKLCAAAKELDTILGLPDCEDPKKGEWLEQVKERVRQHELAKIEKRLGG